MYGANHGDLQAAAIDANVAAQDHARAFGESQARAAEAAHIYNAEAVRQVAETNRDIHENAYWNGVAHSQNVVAAAQSQAAALDGHAAAARATYAGHGYAGHLGYAAPLAYSAPLAYGAHLGYGYPHAHAW